MTEVKTIDDGQKDALHRRANIKKTKFASELKRFKNRYAPPPKKKK